MRDLRASSLLPQLGSTFLTLPSTVTSPTKLERLDKEVELVAKLCLRVHPFGWSELAPGARQVDGVLPFAHLLIGQLKATLLPSSPLDERGCLVGVPKPFRVILHACHGSDDRFEHGPNNQSARHRPDSPSGMTGARNESRRRGR